MKKDLKEDEGDSLVQEIMSTKNEVVVDKKVTFKEVKISDKDS